MKPNPRSSVRKNPNVKSEKISPPLPLTRTLTSNYSTAARICEVHKIGFTDFFYSLFSAARFQKRPLIGRPQASQWL